jgi:hypothetical protein
MKKKHLNKQCEFSQELWTRLALLIVAVIFFYPIGLILLILVLINLITAAIKKEPNAELVEFSDMLSQGIIKFLRYLLFISKEKPFFSKPARLNSNV